MALDLSHRYSIKQSCTLPEKLVSNNDGILMGEESVPVDIGNLPILDALQTEGVGGLLGADLLIRIDIVRFNLSGGRPTMTWIQTTET